MGEAERYQEYKKNKPKKLVLGYDGNALMALFTINIIFFLLLLTIKVIFFFYHASYQNYQTDVLQWFQLPASLQKLSEQPWALFTYMFTDTTENIMRALANMLWLWAFGYVFQQLNANEKIIPVYLYGGVAGAVGFIGAYYLIPALHLQISSGALLGANCGTIAVATAATALDPYHRFYREIRGGISLWIILLIYVIIDFISVASVNAAHLTAHVTAAAAGLLFVFSIRKGWDPSAWMNKLYYRIMHLFQPVNKNNHNKQTIFYNANNRPPYQKRSLITQNKVDEILDKINLKGYHFLTDEEKEILRKASEEEDLN